MFSLTKMSSLSEDYYLDLVQYYLGKRRRKRKKRSSDLPDDPAAPSDDDDADGLLLGDVAPYSTALPGEPPGRWFGQGATALGLSGIVEEEPYRRVFRGFHPITEEPLVQNAGVLGRRPGWEACFSPPKDFSVVWSQAPPEVQRRLQALNWDAAAATLRLFEQSFAFSRAGKDGCQRVPVGIVVPMFEHASSRAEDPDLHIHAQILNTGIDEHGHARTIDPLPLFQNQHLFGAFYRAKLAASLRAEFGIVAEQHGRSFRLQGVPQELVQRHSQRRQQILDHLKKHGRRGAKAAAIAALETRATKDPLVSRDELLQRWRSVNTAAGFDDAHVTRLLRHGPRKPGTTVRKAIREAVKQVTRSKNHFTRQELTLQTLWGLPKHGLDPTDVLPAIADYLGQSDEIVSLGTADGQPRYTTKKVLDEEQRMLTAIGRMAKRPGLSVSEHTLREQLRKRPTMRKEQADFVKHMTQSRSAVRVGLGFAGTGKTYALKTCVDAWRRQGYRVLAAAPTGQAARILGREIGIECTTLTRLLGDFRLPLSAAVFHHARQLSHVVHGRRTRRFRQPHPARVTRNTILLVDEAGMIGTRHMRMIAELVEQNGGTLCLVGDPAQLPAIETTSPLDSLARRHGAARLVEIRRQKETWAREAAKALARGDAGQALTMFAARNCVTVRDGLDEAVRQACLDWTAEGLHTPHRAIILANTNEMVQTANDVCQEHRLRAGCLDSSSSIQIVDEQDDACWGSHAYAGDRVLFTKNSPRIGVENGSLGTVIAIHPFSPKIHVVLDDGRHVTVDVRSFPHIRLGYAATTHKSQGASIPKVFVVLGGNLQNLPASYVQATRAIEETSFYTTNELISPYLEQVDKSSLAKEMSRKPDLRLASDFLAQAPVELRRRRSKVRHVVTAAPTETNANAAEVNQSVASPVVAAESQPQPSSDATQDNSVESSRISTPNAAGRQAHTNQNQSEQRQNDCSALPQPQPAVVPFDGTYQRLRLAGGARPISNGYMLVASCVDGGLDAHRHRPPPPRGMAMPFAAESVVVQRISPTPTPQMSISEAHRTGMLTLIGTGCQDHVQVFCRPDEMWIITVQDSLGLISPQDDIAAGRAYYNSPSILRALEHLDEVDAKLQEFAITPSLLRSVFACMRRQAAWLMPNAVEPLAVSRDFLGRFCRMFFEDPCSRYLIQRLSRLAEPLEREFPQQVLESRIRAPYSVPPHLIRNLSEALTRRQTATQTLVACFNALADQMSPEQRQRDHRHCCEALAEGVATIRRTLDDRHPDYPTQWRLMQTLYRAAQRDIPSGAEFLDVLTQYVPLDHELLKCFAPVRFIWLYATHYLNGDEAKAASLYNDLLQDLAASERQAQPADPPQTP